MDEEESQTRDNVRELVIQYLVDQRGLLAKYTVPGTESEKILIDQLLKVRFFP